MPDKPTYEELEQRVRELENADKVLRKKNQNQFQLLYEGAPFAYQILNEDGNIVEINPSWLNMLGFCRKEVVGKSFCEFLSPEWAEYFKKQLRHFTTVGDAFELEFEMMKKDGSSIFVSFHGKMGKDKSGNLQQIHCIFHDITERRQTEDALRTSEEKYRRIFDHLQDGYLWADSDGKILLANVVAANILGYDLQELMQKNMAGDLYFVPGERETVKQIMRRNGKIENYEVAFKKKDGQKIIVEANSHLVQDDNQQVSMEGTFRDITFRKQTEIEKRRLESQLRQAQKMEAIGTLAGGIAHDFNNILSGIFGFSQLAETHIEEPEKAKGYIKIIVKGASRAAELVQQILTFSQKTDVAKQSLNLFAVAKEALKLIRSTIPASIEIKEQINSKASIFADPIQMHQVIMNLCTNAYHAMSKSGGELIVGLNETFIPYPDDSSVINMDQKFLELEVSDTGHGMDENTIERIFDPYFTTKTRKKGTGLGLALVHAIVEEHGGTIRVNSRVGKGSTFLIYLPVAEKKGYTVPKNIRAKTIPTGTESILFVEDEDDIRSFVQDFLESYGYTLTLCENGQKAYEEFKKLPHGFDVVVTDMAMPKMNGDELALKILKIRKDLPIILCTGYTEKLNREQAKKMGIARYIDKPIAGRELCLLIREVLDEKKMDKYD